MTTSPNKARKGARRQPATPRSGPADGLTTMNFVGGLLLLAIGLATSLMLVLDHFGGIKLPGCGQGSPCAAAAASWWGKVPGTAWPISFVGLAYFGGLLIAWLTSRQGAAAPLRVLVRIGVALSVMYIVVLIVEKHLCYYCLGTHAANLGFWLVLEGCRRKTPGSLVPFGAACGMFLLVSIGLYAAESRTKQSIEASQEEQRLESTQKIITATSEQAQSNSETQTTQPQQPVDPTKNATATPDSQDATDRPWTGGFTGRYRLGPEEAQARIVMITDYQCPDCYRIEGEVMAMLDRQPTVSLSVKHFPMCKDCNRHFPNSNFHPNACWAARAAEAAGMLRGNEGFWQMHRWLFANKGTFTNEKLTQGLSELGFDPQEFLSVMQTPATLELVQADIEEAIWLGLHFTPMIFVNGVELKGVFSHNAVPRTVRQVLAQNPPAMTADLDQPPPAIDKLVSDWRDQYPRNMPHDSQPWATGPDDAKVNIVMWADYQEQYTAVADRAIRKWMAGRSDVRYTFRHFPFNQACNPVVSRTAHALACRASAAAEAAGTLGGTAAYWKMHNWLMDHQKEFNDTTLKQAAVEMGLDVDALFKAMGDPRIAENIREDALAAQQELRSTNSMLYRGGIPTIYVNGKVIPRWRLEQNPIIDLILNEAAQK